MKHTNFVIIGGDKRQKYLGEYLKFSGFAAENYGLYDWDETNERLKSIIKPDSVVILPLPVSKTGKTVFMPFSKRELPFSRLISLLGAGNTVFGGIFPESLSKMLKAQSIPFYDYYDSTYVSENAYLTAFGALKIILEHIDFAVTGGKFAVTGYGKVGRETADILKRLSCDVTVFARSKEARTNAALHGCRAKPLTDFAETAEEFDIILNTVPSKVIDGKALEKIRPDCKIIELASAPFGVDFSEAAKYSVSVIKASGLPGKYTAKTAGELTAGKILKILQKGEENE